MTSHVEQAITARIARVRAEEERKRQQRTELAAARKTGLGYRHAAKLRHVARSQQDPAAVGQSPTTVVQTTTVQPNRGDPVTVASAARTENPTPPKETPMAATTKPVHILLLCPACRAQRRCKPVGTATVAKRHREVVECGDASCGLQWVAARQHLDAASTAA